MRVALLVALSLSRPALAATIEHWWNVTYLTASPDGLYSRRVVGVNGTWPPPPLSATQGDVVKVHVTNSLGDPSLGTALHTHGLFFRDANWADGATQTTQCPIPINQTLTYVIDTSEQTGTYWAHGHHMGQYTDGLRTPFIIQPQNGTGRSDNVTWDDEYTLIVGDWYHDEYMTLVNNEFLTWKNPTGAEPVPKSALIYVAANNTYLSPNADLMAGKGVNDDAVLPFVAGKTYKIRVINMSALAMFYINFDQHDVQIIETDGVEIEPFAIDTLTISIGQRYSLLVTAKNATDTNYALSVMQSPDMYDAIPDDLVLNNTLQIVYNTSAPLAISPDVQAAAVIDDTKFVPVLQRTTLSADVEYTLDAYFDTYDDGTNRASFNNVTYQMPNTPSIFTAMTMGNGSLRSDVYGAQTNAFAYKYNSTVQLTIRNWDAGFHPFHLHGHEFQVVHKSFDLTSDDPTINPPFNDSLVNPARRDTVTVPPGGSTTIRWKADNPGAWMMHCHVDWHMSSGLVAIFIEGPEEIQRRAIAPPQQIYDHCKYWNMATSGNIVGKNSTTDFAGQPWGPFPLVMGWTPKAIGALAACIITFLIGVASIIFYASGELDEKDIEEELRFKAIQKKQKKSLLSRVTRIEQ